MRVTLTAGDRTVDIRIDGSEGDGIDALRRVENSAKRLFAALPKDEPTAAEAEDPPFGFALSADTTLSGPPPQREHDIEQDDEPDERRTAP